MRRLLLTVILFSGIGVAWGQAAPGPAAAANAAKTWSEAEILSMFRGGTPKKAISWGTTFRFAGNILAGSALVYGALDWLYKQAQQSITDVELEAEFGGGPGRVIGRVGIHGVRNPEGTGARWVGWEPRASGLQVFDSGVKRDMQLAEAIGLSETYSGSLWVVTQGWTQVSNGNCPVGGTGVMACYERYGYLPASVRADGVGERLPGLQRVMSDYVDANPLSDTAVGLWPGMAWEGVGPNLNQWTDSLVNPGLDTDRDGYSDGREIEAGTDPSNADSYPGGAPDVSVPRPVPEVDVPVAPTPELPEAPDRVPVEPQPAPQPSDPVTYPDRPARPGPDPEDNPEPSSPGQEEEVDEETNCWPLACESTLMAMYNATVHGNTLSADVRAELDYQTEVLLGQYAELEYQSEVALEELRQAEYEVALIEALLEHAAGDRAVAEAQLDEAEYQRSVHLATLEQLQYQSETLVDQFSLMTHMATVQSGTLAEAERQTFLQEEMLRELQRDDETAAPELDDLNVELEGWQPGELSTEVWTDIQTALADVIGDVQTAAAGKLMFLSSGWVPALSLAGGGDCAAINMPILGHEQDVSVCNTPVHTVLATTARTALLAVMVLAFWLGMTRWVATS